LLQSETLKYCSHYRSVVIWQWCSRRNFCISRSIIYALPFSMHVDSTNNGTVNSTCISWEREVILDVFTYKKSGTSADDYLILS
jgi:hypothetical protein